MSSSYPNTVEVCSKLPEFAGVSFVLNRVSYGLRTRLRRDLVPALQRIRHLNELMQLEVSKYGLDSTLETNDTPETNGMVLLEDEAVPTLGEASSIAPGTVTKKFTPEQEAAVDRITDLGQQIDLATDELSVPVYLKHGLVSVNGLLDATGQPYTATSLYQTGPEDLCREILEEFMGMVNPTRKTQANLESPITSGAVADGQMIHTIAPNVNGNKPTESGIAPSISQNE
jgi:hypothetical protein